LIRHQPSGAQNCRVARERARVLAAAGQLELKLLVRAADFEPLILTGDLSEDDLTTSGRLADQALERPLRGRCFRRSSQNNVGFSDG
jgi:hypothetical protein